jgi:hypothetical protein
VFDSQHHVLCAATPRPEELLPDIALAGAVVGATERRLERRIFEGGPVALGPVGTV